MLPTPFSAAEIRATWTDGFEVVMVRTTPEGTVRERWRVVAADDTGCEIEFTPVDESGEPVGDGVVRPSGWVELRDHAAFPAATAERRRWTRDTSFGTLKGWQYEVRNPEEGTLSKLFFADGYAGAPVWMESTRDGKLLVRLEQVERTPPGES